MPSRGAKEGRNLVLLDLFYEPDNISDHTLFLVDIGDMRVEEVDEVINALCAEAEAKGCDLRTRRDDLVNELCRRTGAKIVEFNLVEVLL